MFKPVLRNGTYDTGTCINVKDKILDGISRVMCLNQSRGMEHMIQAHV